MKQLLEKMDSMMEIQKQGDSSSQLVKWKRKLQTRPPAAKRPRLHPQDSLSTKDHLAETFSCCLWLVTTGTLLKLLPEQLKEIRTNNSSSARDCLREMLEVWLKKIVPSPTWEAVEPLDPARAESICSQHCQS